MTLFHKYLSNKSFQIVGVILSAFILIATIVYAYPDVMPLKFGGVPPTPPLQNIEEQLPEFSNSTPTPVSQSSPKKTSDPIVKCMLNECGTVEMTSSQCKLSGCCVLKNEIRVMTDQAECTRLQNGEISKSTGNSNNQLSQRDLILKNAQNNAKSLEAQLCLEQAKRESDTCLDDCLSASTEGSGVCRYASDNLGWTTEKFSECLNENSGIYDKCGDDCINTMTTKQNECLAKQKQ